MLTEKLLTELRDYVKSRLAEPFLESPSIEMMLSDAAINLEMEDFINTNRKPSFREVLFKMIDERGFRDSDIYKKAGIDRRHFSKIRTNPKYRVSKNTAIALAIALELDIDETEDLLNSAGYSLSDSETFDLVIQFCIEKKIYNLDAINEALYYFSLKPLSGVSE